MPLEVIYGFFLVYFFWTRGVPSNSHWQRRAIGRAQLGLSIVLFKSEHELATKQSYANFMAQLGSVLLRAELGSTCLNIKLSGVKSHKLAFSSTTIHKQYLIS